MTRYNTKYFIDGVSLSKYCQLHGLNYDTCRSRIILKHLTVEEAVRHPYNSHSYHYLSSGESLIDYCVRTGLCLKLLNA